MMARSRERIIVDIPVTVTSVLDSMHATIVDLSEDGALMTANRLPTGNRLMIDFEGQSVFATVIWAELDRMGVLFPFPLSEGPLYTALETARATRGMFMPTMTRVVFGRRAIR